MAVMAITKHSVIVSGHRTSVSMEFQFWDEVMAVAARRGVSINDLVTEIDHHRDGNLSSAIRLFVLAELKRLSA